MFVENWWLTSRVSFSQFPTKKHPRKLLLISNYWALNQSVYPNIDFAGIYIPNIDFGEWSGICFGQILATREIPSPIQTWNKFGGDCFLLDSRRPYYRQVKTLTNAWNTPFSSWKFHCCVQVNSIASNIQTNPSTDSLKLTLTTFASGVGGSIHLPRHWENQGLCTAMLVSMRVTPQPKNHQKPPTTFDAMRKIPRKAVVKAANPNKRAAKTTWKMWCQGKSKTQKLKSKQKHWGVLLSLFVYECYAREHLKRVRVPKSIWCVVKLWDVIFRFSAHWRLFSESVRFIAYPYSVLSRPLAVSSSHKTQRFMKLQVPTTSTIIKTRYWLMLLKQPTWDNA